MIYPPYKYAYGIALALGFLFSFAPIVFADSTITTTASMSNVEAFGYASNSYRDNAQSFIADASGTIASVVAAFKSPVLSTGNVTIAIYTDNAGEPGTLIDSDVITPTRDNACTDYTATFSSPVAVTASQQYWIVWIPANYSVANYYFTCGSGTFVIWEFDRYDAAWVLDNDRTARISLTIVESGGDGTSATSTSIINPSQNLFNGFLLFFISMWFPIWFFRKLK